MVELYIIFTDRYHFWLSIVDETVWNSQTRTNLSAEKHESFEVGILYTSCLLIPGLMRWDVWQDLKSWRHYDYKMPLEDCQILSAWTVVTSQTSAICFQA